ncbi:anti-phage dCTP deaminase [Dickeya oryzae]|uniref:anti-phage dCTP deaminase n=1 Tax=Dickeya oryzae TaxID=1240404 RepID=UPI001AECD338|nr:anti-phage dCTP deaminase [Dickeya oryzae]MBP2851119.1 dCMP deaminase family protein [Dickeya oryzae]
MEVKSAELIKNKDDSPEVVIGLVGAIGTNLEQIKTTINGMLATYSYDVMEIRISSEIIRKFKKTETSAENYININNLMTAGNELREKSKNNAILSMAVSALISSHRDKEASGIPKPKSRKAYIIHSLKHPDEVNLLRDIYTNGFYLIGVYSDEERRKDYLINHKAVSNEEADLLIKRDAHEGDKWGQHTRDTYELADFFVNSENNYDKVTNHLWRFFDLIFGKPNITPTFDEYAMSMAYSASLRSADLSRQVGAVLTKNKMILTTGANDIPTFGGGLYWPEMIDDKIQDIEGGRDYTIGYDSNADEKKNIINDIIEKFENNIDKTENRTLINKKNKISELILDALNNSKIKDITEYGRVVHAEMEAILSCARSEINTFKTTLYCTTFPCHNCAKHIVASGIEKVFYIEPYPKSKAFSFHKDSIESSESSKNSQEVKKVIFEPFVGVGPRCFFNLFSINLGTGYKVIRKESDGKVVKWERKNGRLRIQMLPSSYIEKELKAADSLNKIVRENLKC